MSGFDFRDGKNYLHKALVCVLLVCICFFPISCAPQIPKDLTPKMTVAMWMMYAFSNQWDKSEFYCTPHFISNDQQILKIAAKHVDPSYVEIKELPKNKAGIAEYLYYMDGDASISCTYVGDTAKVGLPEFQGMIIVLMRINDRWMLDHLEGIPNNYNVEDVKKAEKLGAFD